ncbi:MAG: beta-lactamase family protein [Gammaproteobacteria bacterium]|nr:beta-lactamase family protein [Gammaproteobacteria bacterium]
MKNLVLISLFSLISLPNMLKADNETPSAKCQVYKTCSKQGFVEIFSVWDLWNSGSLNISHDEWVTKQLEKHFKVFACDEVAAACESDRAPNTQHFLEKYTTLPEVEWERNTPKESGLNSIALEMAISEASQISHLRSLLIVTNGKLVVEKYCSRKNDPRPQHLQSVTKSITSLLIGIAIDKGFIKSENEVIKPYFPEYFSKPHDERKEKITIQQLLTMTSRLNFVDNPTYTSYKDINSWWDPGRWEEYWYSDNYLDRPLEDDLVESIDDQVAIYSTPSCNLLTTILRKSTNMTTKEFADQYLFGPLGIKNYAWIHDSANNYIGGHTLFLRPRALARIGQLILDGGKFEDQEIISQDWLKKSFSVSVPKWVNMVDVPQKVDYGYLWWLGEYKNYKYQFAWGHGGQFLFLIPDANTLIVTTAYPDPDGTTHWEKSQRIIKNIMHNVIKALPDKN